MRNILDNLIIFGLLLPMGSAVAGLGLVITIHAAALYFTRINVCREFGVAVPWIIASALFAISVGVAWSSRSIARSSEGRAGQEYDLATRQLLG